MNSQKVRVLKFGGSSVATPELIRQVASIIKKQQALTPKLLVVVSAMGKSTDQLLKLALDVSPNSTRYRREVDMLLTTGERVSMALLSMALEDQNISSISFTGSQSGIITDEEHGEAHIVEIRAQRIIEALASGKVVIVAGFQGVSRKKEITTLGRGGSDTSAVALGAALGADQVDIYTDVDGFYTADPRKIPAAKKIVEIPLRTAYLAASRGAKVLHPRCLEIAYRHKTRVRVLSTFQPENGGSMIVEKLSKTLEGPQVLQICRQDSLCLLKFPTTLSIEAQEVISSDYLEMKSDEHGTSVLLNEAQKNRWATRLTGHPALLKVLDQSQNSLSRVSILGSGLDQASDMSQKISSLFRAAEIDCLTGHQNESQLDFLVKTKPSIDALMLNLHEEFIE